MSNNPVVLEMKARALLDSLKPLTTSVAKRYSQRTYSYVHLGLCPKSLDLTMMTTDGHVATKVYFDLRSNVRETLTLRQGASFDIHLLVKLLRLCRGADHVQLSWLDDKLNVNIRRIGLETTIKGDRLDGKLRTDHLFGACWAAFEPNRLISRRVMMHTSQIPKSSESGYGELYAYGGVLRDFRDDQSTVVKVKLDRLQKMLDQAPDQLTLGIRRESYLELGFTTVYASTHQVLSAQIEYPRLTDTVGLIDDTPVAEPYS